VRIGLFTDSNIFYIDGVGRIIQALIRHVEARPEHSLLVFHRSRDAEPAKMYGANITIRGVGARYVHVPGYDAYPFFYLSNPRGRLLAEARDFRPDLLLTVTPYVPRGIGRAALAVGRNLDVPVVGSFDVPLAWYSDYYARKLFRFDWAVSLWHRFVSYLMSGYRSCKAIVVPSRAMETYAHELYGDVDCVLFPRAVDCEKFSPAFRDESFRARHGLADKVIILYLGRLALEKNLAALGEMYASLKSRNPQIALLVVGEGPERKQLADRGTPDMVFTGSLYGEDLLRAYASADIFAFPSVVDAGPMVILEAQASGLPVIAPNTGGAQDCIVSGETGFVVADMTEFEKRLEELIQDEPLRAYMSSNARKLAEGRAWDPTLERLLADLAAVAAR
jgi:phosphatidylinositol alpha 1,6-mannosyltransferase